MGQFNIDKKFIFNTKTVVLPKTAGYRKNPICIGGIGGSGTRVVADLVSRMNVFIGNNINGPKDNFDLPLNQKLNGVTDYEKGIEIICETLESFELTMHNESNFSQWGWKIPGNFYWLDYLNAYFTEIRYIHVIRNGLDMAYSKNNNQIRNWGGLFGIVDVDSPPTPKQLLEFWVVANNFAINKALHLLGERALIVKYENLCKEPEVEIKKIANFIGYGGDEKYIHEMCLVVENPASLGRYKQHNISKIFGMDLVDKVRDFGFDVQV